MVGTQGSQQECCRDKRQDVFISYSHHDAAWVEGELLPRLEHPDPAEHAKQVTLHAARGGCDTCPAQYTCVVHSRDWVPGRPVPDQILESVETSRRTVIVLSSHYVQSMWSNLEFRAAHSKAIEENIQVCRYIQTNLFLLI